MSREEELRLIEYGLREARRELDLSYVCRSARHREIRDGRYAWASGFIRGSEFRRAEILSESGELTRTHVLIPAPLLRAIRDEEARLQEVAK